MSKFIYLQDAHISGKNSAHYTSDYFNDCLLMLDEVLSIAKKNKVDAIIDGGDLLHTPEPSYRILDEIADRVEKYKIPIYSLFGNHAERYHSMEHSRYTGHAHLIKRSEYFRYLEKIDGYDFIVNPVEYSHNVEEDIKKNGITFEKTDKFKIAIVHAFVCPKEFPFATHVVCDDIKTNADVCLIAHYHNQWSKKVGNTQFIDIGCLGRRSITEAEIKPTILLIDTEKRDIKKIPLKSANPPEDIFDLTKVEELKDKKNGIEEFLKSVEDVQFQENRVKDNVKFIGKEKGFAKEPVNLILTKIDELELDKK